MREHDLAARRMVRGGGAVLAVALLGLALAASVLVGQERRAGVEASRLRTTAAADEFVAALSRAATEAGVVRIDLDAELRPTYPALRPFDPRPAVQPFDRLPEPGEPETRFLLDEMRSAATPELARAAAAEVLRTGDEPARLAAAAWLTLDDVRAGRAPSVTSGPPPIEPGPFVFPEKAWWAVNGFRVTDPSDEIRHTREYLLLIVLADPPAGHDPGIHWSRRGAIDELCSVLGTRDDTDAAALLVVGWGDPKAATLAIRRVREQRRLAQIWPSLVGDGTARRIGESEYLPRFEEDGAAALVASRLSSATWQGAWTLQRVPAALVADVARRTLEPAGVRLAGRAAEVPERAVAVPVAPGWLAWRAPDPDDRTRSGLLLAGIGVAALAALIAFAAFARAVRREAKAAAARADFVSTVSHELRTPVAVVRTAAETLLAGRAVRDDDRRQLLEGILRESERLSGLVGNVLDFARIDAGTRRYAFRETAPEDVIEETVRRTAPARAALGFRVDVEIPAPLPRIVCDADALGAALANLLDNAVKFRGTSDHATVRATVHPAGDTDAVCDAVTIEVEDHGVGVPDAEKPRIGERFFRGASAAVRETRGSGIGLSLVRHAAEAHGGRVEVIDTPGGGATFRVVVPVRPLAGATA